MRGKYLYIALLSLASCVDPINFDVPNDSSFLVVEGFITDDYGPHRIKLSRSAKYASIFNKGEEKPVAGATLSIVDNLGTIITLREIFDGEGDSTYLGRKGYNGNYETPASFRGIVGNQYSLQIAIDGKTYQSSHETLMASSPIDSVTYSYVSKPSLDESNKVANEWGLEFYASFNSTSDATDYKLSWENTYIFVAPRGFGVDLCYVNESSSGFVNILRNESFETYIKNYSVNFVPVDFKFNYKYSMNIILYAMNDHASIFWNQLSSQTKVTGSIFDPTSTKITGNIQNINDSKEVVLGYFGAFGKAEKRVFIDALEAGILIGSRDFFYDQIDACFPLNTVPPIWCRSCVYYPGSQKEKPDFWEG